MQGKLNSFYIIIGLAFVTMLSINTEYFKGSRAFLGVTYAKKYQINAEKPAIIEQTHVVPGETVEPGQILVEMQSPALELEIQKLEQQIQNYESEMTEKAKILESKLKLYESEKRIIKNETENKITQLESEIALNKNISEQLLTTSSDQISRDSSSTKTLEIKAIRERGQLELDAVDIRVRDLKQDYQYDLSQVQSSINITQQELNWKNDERDKLNKYATYAGVIDNVYVKPGEQVEAFSSVVSINPLHPTSVVGYLVGSKDRNRELGEEVLVRSLEQNEIEAVGKIIGFGSVVQLPDILQKSTAVQAFGLEVFIEISDENRMPVGEKVMIK